MAEELGKENAVMDGGKVGRPRLGLTRFCRNPGNLQTANPFVEQFKSPSVAPPIRNSRDTSPGLPNGCPVRLLDRRGMINGGRNGALLVELGTGPETIRKGIVEGIRKGAVKLIVENSIDRIKDDLHVPDRVINEIKNAILERIEKQILGEDE